MGRQRGRNHTQSNIFPTLQAFHLFFLPVTSRDAPGPGRPRLDPALLRKKAPTIFQERRDERKSERER